MLANRFMETGMEANQDKLREQFDNADSEVKQVVLAVFKLESERLYMSKPRVKDEIVDTIKRIVQ
jgi:hypothetical protein